MANFLRTLAKSHNQIKGAEGEKTLFPLCTDIKKNRREEKEGGKGKKRMAMTEAMEVNRLKR